MKKIFNSAVCLDCGTVTFSKYHYLKNHKCKGHDVVVFMKERSGRFEEELEKALLEMGK